MNQSKEKPSHWYGFKGFAPGLVCRVDDEHVKQYAENTVFEEEGGKIRRAGMMHYVAEPLAVFRHYAPAINGKKSEYAHVEAIEEPITDDDKKYATKKLKVGAKIDIAELVTAQIEYVRERCEIANTGGDCSANRGGDCSANTGGYGSANTGGYGSANTGGDCSANRGGDCSANTGGDCSANRGGDCSANTGGYWSTFDIGGCAVALGRAGSKYKGGMWSVFAQPIIQEGKCVGMYIAVVDGENIKPDVWYEVIDGTFVERAGE